MIVMEYSHFLIGITVVALCNVAVMGTAIVEVLRMDRSIREERQKIENIIELLEETEEGREILAKIMNEMI